MPKPKSSCAALTKNPRRAGLCDAAVALSKLNRFREALDETKIAIRLDPTIAYVFYARSLVLMRTGHYRSATEAVREAIRLDGDNPEQFYVLAWLLSNDVRWNESLDTVDRALELAPAACRQPGTAWPRAAGARPPGRGKASFRRGAGRRSTQCRRTPFPRQATFGRWRRRGARSPVGSPSTRSAHEE